MHKITKINDVITKVRISLFDSLLLLPSVTITVNFYVLSLGSVIFGFIALQQDLSLHDRCILKL